MFAQMPLFVYRHFTGAVCTTSSDGRFMGMIALFLSNSSDMVRSPTSRSRPQLVACSARPIQNFLPGTTVAIVESFGRMARPRAAPGTECEAVRCGRAGCVAVEGEGSCVADRSEETEDFNFKRRFSP